MLHFFARGSQRILRFLFHGEASYLHYFSISSGKVGGKSASGTTGLIVGVGEGVGVSSSDSGDSGGNGLSGVTDFSVASSGTVWVVSGFDFVSSGITSDGCGGVFGAEVTGSVSACGSSGDVRVLSKDVDASGSG